jgi:hypothetical protein
MVIDFHAHYLAREHLQMHAKTPDGRTVGSSMRGQGKDAVMETSGIPLGTSCKPEDFYDLAARLEFMAATGVDVEVFSPPPSSLGQRFPMTCVSAYLLVIRTYWKLAQENHEIGSPAWRRGHATVYDRGNDKFVCMMRCFNE